MILNQLDINQRFCMKLSFIVVVSAAIALAFPFASYAEDYVITLKDQKFSPQELTIPAGEKVKLTVKNMDAATAEFESHDLRREKLIAPGAEIVVSIGPLKPGKYEYFDEFHEDTSRGMIVAK